MKRWMPALLVGLVMVAGWLALRGDPDVRAINRAFDQLNEAAQWEQREDMLRAGLAARRILGFCVKDIVFDVHDVPYRFTNRGELQAAIIHARSMVDALTLDVSDREIELGPERSAAEMFVTARVTVHHPRDTSSDLRSVKLTWKKTEDGWMLAGVESYDTIDGS